MFQYSPRPATKAASFADQVPKQIVQDRFDRLVALQESISLERAREQLGRVEEVLIEGRSKRGDATQGRTRANRIVHVREPLSRGAFASVVITDAAAHYLAGELVAAAEPAAALG